jgi:hypothetical protein
VLATEVDRNLKDVREVFESGSVELSTLQLAKDFGESAVEHREVAPEIGLP